MEASRQRGAGQVARMQEKKPSIVIAVSEGVKLEDGRYVCELADDVHAVDAFGHKALTGAAVKAAFEGHTGEMVALKRISNAPYQCTTELTPIYIGGLTHHIYLPEA